MDTSQVSLPENKVCKYVYMQDKLLDRIATIIVIFTQGSNLNGAEHLSQMHLKSTELMCSWRSV